MESSTLRKRTPMTALLDPRIVFPAIGSAFAKLDPRTLASNPIIFVLEIVTLLTTVLLASDLVTGGGNLGFTAQIVLWLWFTVLFANFAEAVAEGRGKAPGRRAEAHAHGNTGQTARRGQCQELHARPRDQP
jgi:K+-transporting ATPase ATPase B chain